MTAPGRFCFLNREEALEFPTGWNNADLPKLWLYNLHYFDDLNAEGYQGRVDSHRELVGRWIAENPPGLGNGWEPYTLSLRIVNWIKWHLGEQELSPEALESLAVQVRFLCKLLEFHLLGNHLWANAKALVFAGLFFDGPEAQGWLERGLTILATEIPEQILPDGGHFERSPMYHSIILEDLLDLKNLFVACGRPFPEDWVDAVERMRRWLKTMSHSDGGIVLLNDAAFGIAPEPEALEDYAARLGLKALPPQIAPLSHLPDSGYIRLEEGDAVAILDVAPVGPDYIPGHAHADTLSFELSLFGQRVLVDSGTSTYEKDAERQRQRGTAAHNTVEVDGQDSSEVWGGFRVARRARPFDLQVERGEGGGQVSCSHDGYRRLPGKVTHRREWALAANRFSVTDRLEGGFAQAVARFHFHPEVRVVMTGEREGRAELPGGQSLSFEPHGGKARLVDGSYHPEFGVTLPSQVLEVPFDGAEIKVCFFWG